MLRPRMLIALMVFLLGATGVRIASKPASAQEQTPSTAATDTPVRKPGKMDPKHPLHIGDKYYPDESRKHHEQGRCSLAFFVQS